ncbi:hypothetical protein ACFSW8_15750, partial [Rubritalea tangerina]
MKLACVHSSAPNAVEAFGLLSERYTFVAPEEADAIVVLGGDGMLLHSIHAHRHLGLPFFGMNRGTVGNGTDLSGFSCSPSMRDFSKGF